MLAVFLAGLAWLGPGTDKAHALDEPEVDLALVVAIDTSGSVNDEEFRLQLISLASAFRDRRIVEAISKGPYAQIFVTLFQWSSEARQEVVVPWSLIANSVDADAFASEIEIAQRMPTEGATSISAAIEFGVDLIEAVPGRPLRRVIDLSADGGNNNGNKPQAARDRAISSAITINGLAVINEVPHLDAYFERFVIGGTGAFVKIANDYYSYRDAIVEKLVIEILGPAMS